MMENYVLGIKLPPFFWAPFLIFHDFDMRGFLINIRLSNKDMHSCLIYFGLSK